MVSLYALHVSLMVICSKELMTDVNPADERYVTLLSKDLEITKIIHVVTIA
jgi:hypothetical protein